MKYIVQLNDIDLIEPLIDRGVEAITIGYKDFSSGAVIESNDQMLETVCKQVDHRMKIYVLMNQLYHQDRISALKEALIQLNTLKIDGLFFQDFGLLNLVQENHLNFSMIYAPDTLNTNHQTLNTLSTLGIDGFFLSGQLHLDEVDTIVSETKSPCIVPVHGVQYIAYSKRKLLTNYFDQINKPQPVGYKEHLVMKVNNKEEYSYIYEDHSGTHVYTTNELCTLGMNMPGDYGYIETLYLDKDYVLDVIDHYLAQDSYEAFVSSHPDHHYDHGFIEDGTVYKIEDVRKREENEKR